MVLSLVGSECWVAIVDDDEMIRRTTPILLIKLIVRLGALNLTAEANKSFFNQ